ncbi:MAG: HU family DNA-binding protein [Candidatus Omnitrophica bacterium]|nr:HU family DNA-binding protein [Candidatus Omnitrophota bacterium]
MNKSELASEISKKTQISKAKAWETLNATIESIKSSLKKGKKVSLVGFGSFSVKQRKARTGRNPKTGETIQIKARKVPSFQAGSEFKKMLK